MTKIILKVSETLGVEVPAKFISNIEVLSELKVVAISRGFSVDSPTVITEIEQPLALLVVRDNQDTP